MVENGAIMTKRRRLIRKLDLLWSKKVKESAGMRCEKCGKTKYLNSHHFYSRSAWSVRWNLNNGFSLCSGCHTLSSRFSAHKTPAEFVEWAKKKRGDDWFARLQMHFNIMGKFTIEDLENKVKELEDVQ